ncbi:MAG: hypothetical protein CL946_00290 [Ectothiorhodospiraceae bacterium]|nr:hypothetical protein [Ectothiorhodospiraceae bacterium]
MRVPQEAASEPPPLFDVRVLEESVWVDFMPGAKHRAYAMVRINIVNVTDSTVILTNAFGALSDTLGRNPFRRFNCEMMQDDKSLKSIELMPGLTHELTLKTPVGIEPFDINRYPQVIFSIGLRTKTKREYIFDTLPIDVLKTQ